MDQLESILDHSPTAVITSSLDNRELLYANKAAYSRISKKGRDSPLTCYQASGYDSPCPACSSGRVGQEKSALHELYGPENSHTYRSVGKDIDWAGRPAHIEYISDINRQKLLEQKLDHLVNPIPDGIASCEVREDRSAPVYFSNGVMEISGHTREGYNKVVKNSMLGVIYEADRDQVMAAVAKALRRGEALDVSYRMRHKDGRLIWVHLSGRQIKSFSVTAMFYAVFTGLSSGGRLYQNITSETTDSIYVTVEDTFELLYVNETDSTLSPAPGCPGEKCHTAPHHQEAPCGFCGIMVGRMEGEEYEIKEDRAERITYTRSTEADWSGIPTYVKYMRDITEIVQTRKDKERLDSYFRSIVGQFPGDISMVAYSPDGTMKLEFTSPGFAAMMQRAVEEAKHLYDEDIFTNIRPENVRRNLRKLNKFSKSKEGSYELIARIQQKDGTHLWISSMLSMLPSTDNILRIYIVYADVTETVKEQEQLWRRYDEQLLEHYHKTGANELIPGYSNISRGHVVEMRDSTSFALVKRFGTSRDVFFQGPAGMIIDKEGCEIFLNMSMNEFPLGAYSQNETEQMMKCFIQPPEEKYGRLIQFKVNLLTGPETGEVMGILTVTDITEENISERIFHQLSATSHDFVMDVDLLHDSCGILAYYRGASYIPPLKGSHSGQTANVANSVVLPEGSRQFVHALDAEEMRRRLRKGPYTITFSTTNHGDIRIKNMTIASVEPLLERYCMVCTDITGPVKGQQGLLHMIAYTFELMELLDISNGNVITYARNIVLENLLPDTIENYGEAVGIFTDHDIVSESVKDVQDQFRIHWILNQLEQEPSGYDFVAACQCENGLRYKQFNMLWGNRNHNTVCAVRADVTDAIVEEHEVKTELENALANAGAANEAKSNFLSATSHDIHTPTNAIVGMTTLTFAHVGGRKRLEGCLQKITISSRHLLSLVNDVLDMNQIEQFKISLNHMKLLLPDIVSQLTTVLIPQTRKQDVRLSVYLEQVSHIAFYGDSPRINQILINLLSNAIRFTPTGGRVDFFVEEFVPDHAPADAGAGAEAEEPAADRTQADMRYRFIMQDMGIGMSGEFPKHTFGPFTQEQAAVQIEGAGLGLSIAKKLIDIMGGEIPVESRIGQDSRFTVELESEKAEPSLNVNADKGGTSDSKITDLLTGRRFLVAEDDEISAEILRELLYTGGASCVRREGGVRAVEAFQSVEPGAYDATLMDVQMPGINGYEATRVIHSLDCRDAREVPIIAMTANAFTEDVQAALEAGMNAHVVKPIGMDLLWAALSKVF